MKKIFLIFTSSILLLFSLGCDSSNKPARGPEDEIFVVADSVEYEELRTALETTFEKEIFTPQPEKLFILKRISVKDISTYKN